MADRHEIALFQTCNANLQRNHYLHWHLKLKVPDRSLQPEWDIMYYTSHATLGVVMIAAEYCVQNGDVITLSHPSEACQFPPSRYTWPPTSLHKMECAALPWFSNEQSLTLKDQYGILAPERQQHPEECWQIFQALLCNRQNYLDLPQALYTWR